MLKSVAPGLLQKISALAGTWLDHSALQGSQKLTTMAVKRCSKAGAAGWHNALQKK